MEKLKKHLNKELSNGVHWLSFALIFLISASVISGAWGQTVREQESLVSQIVNIGEARAQDIGCTLYVSIQGSDSNDGKTLNTAFKTIQKAADATQAGDVVCIKEGTYSSFSAVRSGTEGQPITFRAFPGEIVTLQGSGEFSYENVVIAINDKSYIIVDGLKVVQGGIGIEITGSNAAYNQILNCEVSSNIISGIGIYQYAHNNLVKNCYIHGNSTQNWPRGRASGWGQGLSAAHGATNNVFEDNYVYWNHGEGMGAYNAAHGTIWRRNIVADSWSVNMYVDGSKDMIIESNLIYLSPEAKSWPSANSNSYNWNNALGIGVSVECAGAPNCYYEDRGEKTVTGLKIINNIVVNANGGIWAFRNDGNFPIANWTVANNTFINNDAGIRLKGMSVFENNTFRNNIILQANGAMIYDIGSTGSNLFSNNLYSGSQGNAFQWGSSQTDFASWQSLTGDINSNLADPKLEDSVYIPPRFWQDTALPNSSPILSREELVSRYRLIENSPAINAGTPQSAPTTDIEGNLRDSQPDIGAYEFGGTPPPSPNPTPNPNPTPTPTPTSPGPSKFSPDLNCDNKVNVIDFGILLSWWGPYNGDYSHPNCSQ